MKDVDLTLLFNSIAHGDEIAFGQLFQGWYDAIYSVALAYGKSEEIAKDACQQVFMEIWQRRGAMKEVKDPEAWLMTIVRYQTFHIVKKELRNNNYRKALYHQSVQRTATPEEKYMAAEQEKIIREVLAELSPKQQLVYRLSREAGLTYTEIANEIQVGRETVKEHMSNALRSIRKALLRRKNDLISLILAYLLFF